MPSRPAFVVPPVAGSPPKTRTGLRSRRHARPASPFDSMQETDRRITGAYNRMVARQEWEQSQTTLERERKARRRTGTANRSSVLGASFASHHNESTVAGLSNASSLRRPPPPPPRVRPGYLDQSAPPFTLLKDIRVSPNKHAVSEQVQTDDLQPQWPDAPPSISEAKHPIEHIDAEVQAVPLDDAQPVVDLDDDHGSDDHHHRFRTVSASTEHTPKRKTHVFPSLATLIVHEPSGYELDVDDDDLQAEEVPVADDNAPADQDTDLSYEGEYRVLTPTKDRVPAHTLPPVYDSLQVNQHMSQFIATMERLAASWRSQLGETAPSPSSNIISVHGATAAAATANHISSEPPRAVPRSPEPVVKATPPPAPINIQAPSAPPPTREPNIIVVEPAPQANHPDDPSHDHQTLLLHLPPSIANRILASRQQYHAHKAQTLGCSPDLLLSERTSNTLDTPWHALARVTDELAEQLVDEIAREVDKCLAGEVDDMFDQEFHPPAA
ncbi:hypothetical protein RI367_001314 [Sorochytrium milnesiophthora]